MKGFVIGLRKAKNEDSIAIVLTSQDVRSYYRFFGARHSILQLGNLIDFEVEGEQSNFLPRLRSLSHMGFSWLYDHNKLLLWHNFVKLLEPHLRDADDISSFYYHLLLRAAKRWDKQNPKRIVCESYVALLQHEGRLHTEDYCFICEEALGDEISLMQAYIPAHPHCIFTPAMTKQKVFDFFESGKTIYYDDNELELLYRLVMRGL